MDEVPTTLEAADIATILEALPHRYPFLMVDRIINMRGDESAIGIKNVTDQRAAIPRPLSRQSGVSRRAGDRGHGADRRRALRAVAAGRRAPTQVYFLTIDKAKFRKPVRAGRHDRVSHDQDRAEAGTCGGSAARRRSRGRSSPRPKSAPWCHEVGDGGSRSDRAGMSTALSAGAPPVEGPLAIVCGGGSLPFAVADAAQQRGRGVVLFALRGSADAARVAGYPHHWVTIGQVGTVCRLARRAGCRDMVFIGGVVRPASGTLRPDLETLAVAAAFHPHVSRRRRPLAVRHRQHFRGARLQSARRPRGCPANLDAGGAARPLPAERGRSGRHRARTCIPATRPARSTSARPWSSRDAACWRSKPPKAPIKCSRASPNCARGGRIRPRAAACSSRRRSPARTAASICLRSGRRRSRAPRMRGLPALRWSRAARSWPKPSGSRRLADGAKCFRRRRARRGARAMTRAGAAATCRWQR